MCSKVDKLPASSTAQHHKLKINEMCCCKVYSAYIGNDFYADRFWFLCSQHKPMDVPQLTTQMIRFYVRILNINIDDDDYY